MSESKGIVVDPWLKEADKTASLPEDAVLACAYKLDIGVDIIEEAAFFRRTDSTDELWIMAGPKLPDMQLAAGRIVSTGGIERKGLWGIGCVYAVEKSNDEFSACLGLLDRLFRARANYYWPGELISAGIINGPAYNALIWNIEHEMEDNTRKARERETEIVRVARELGLSPQPSSAYFAASSEEH